MKVQGELLRCFFHCKPEWFQPYVPTTSFRLMALRNRVECECYYETNIPLSQFKNATKNNMILNFVPCQVRLILFNTNLNTKNNISYVKTVLKKFQITANFVKSRSNIKNVLASLARIFSRQNSFQNSFEACFNFNLIIVRTSHCKRKKTMVF